MLWTHPLHFMDGYHKTAMISLRISKNSHPPDIKKLCHGLRHGKDQDDSIFQVMRGSLYGGSASGCAMTHYARFKN